MYGWVLKLVGTLLAKAVPSVVKTVAEELAHRFKPIEKYVFEKNELDVKCGELDVQMMDIERKCTGIGFKVTAMQTVLKDLDDKSHPPAIDLEEWEDVKETIKTLKRKKAFKRKDA